MPPSSPSWPAYPCDGAVLATSLAPGGRPGVQAAAVASWRALGLQVLSFNVPAEIDRLAPAFPGVRFVPLARDAAATCGRPLPLLDDLLAGMAAHGARLTPGAPVLFANADIVFRRRPAVLDAALAAAAGGALVMGPRLDVDDLGGDDLDAAVADPLASGEAARGFDWFALPPGLAARLPATGLALGMPFWDYWLPLAAWLGGVPLRRAPADIALHRRHPSQWDHTKFIYFHAFLEAVLAHFRDLGPRATPAETLAHALISYDYREQLAAATAPEASEAAMRGLAAYYDRVFAVLYHLVVSHLQPLEVSAP